MSVILCHFSINRIPRIRFYCTVYHKNRCTREMHGYCTRIFIITARRSYASAVLGVVILSVRLSHGCFVTNAKNLPAIFLYNILITANMQSKTGFPSSHQLKSYVAPKFRLKLAARCPVGCWPSCCVRSSFFCTMSRDWLRRGSRKWPISVDWDVKFELILRSLLHATYHRWACICLYLITLGSWTARRHATRRLVNSPTMKSSWKADDSFTCRVHFNYISSKMKAKRSPAVCTMFCDFRPE